MAIYFLTNSSRALLAAFDQAIDGGHITTWERDADGDYTHKAANWRQKLWLIAIAENQQLAFYTIPPKDRRIQLADYAYYHGHLLETFINHFPDQFSSASATPRAVPSDSIG